MSKSRGNLVFVSKLLESGYSGSVIRLALLQHHYRSEWEWSDKDAVKAKLRLDRWRDGFAAAAPDSLAASDVVAQLRSALANDLDTPLMLGVIDAAAAAGVDDPELVTMVIENLLGVKVCGEK